MTGASRWTSASSRRRLFLCLFSVETIGVVILFAIGIPMYREVLADPAAHEPTVAPLLLSFLAIALIQGSYWVSHRLEAPSPRFNNALFSTLILFTARMGFVFATSVFGVVFIAQKPGFQLPAFRYLVTLVGLFSLYCYVQELERLGAALKGIKQRSTTGNSRDDAEAQ